MLGLCTRLPIYALLTKSVIRLSVPRVVGVDVGDGLDDTHAGLAFALLSVFGFRRRLDRP